MALLDRVWMDVSGTPGTGNITLGSPLASYQSFVDAGAVDGTQYPYVVIDGNDVEIGSGTTSSSGAVFQRTTVSRSIVAGVVGTAKLNLSSSATIFLTARGTDILTTASFASQAQAEAGTDTTTVMSPARTADAIAVLASMSGAFVSLNLYTSSQTITILGTKAYVRMVSSAGGGAGVTSANSGGNIGTCGSYLVATLSGLTVGNTLIYTQGAVGSGGGAGNNAGGNGGSSTLASGTETITTLTCPGGNGGPTGTGAMASKTSDPTGGSINIPGVSTQFRDTTIQYVSGSSPSGGFGIGGPPRNSAGTGNSGVGYGSSAGSGASSGYQYAGAAGQPGALEITWFS